MDKMQEAAESAHEMGKILAVQAKDVDKAKGEANIVKEKVQHSVKEAEKVAVVVENVKQVDEKPKRERERERERERRTDANIQWN